MASRMLYPFALERPGRPFGLEIIRSWDDFLERWALFLSCSCCSPEIHGLELVLENKRSYNSWDWTAFRCFSFLSLAMEASKILRDTTHQMFNLKEGSCEGHVRITWMGKTQMTKDLASKVMPVLCASLCIVLHFLRWLNFIDYNHCKTTLWLAWDPNLGTWRAQRWKGTSLACFQLLFC